MINKYIVKLVKCYNYLLNKSELKSDLMVSDTDSGQTQRVLDTCLIQLNGNVDYKESGISDHKIVDYCVNNVYRMSKMSEKILSFFKVNQIFGKTSVEKYIDSPTGVKYYEGVFLKDLGISRNELMLHIVDKDKHPHQKYIHTPEDERTKMRAINTETGRYLCSKSTLLWSPHSKACGMCKFTHDCKEETKNRFPELYRLRVESIE